MNRHRLLLPGLAVFLALALPAGAESFIAPLGVAGLVKADVLLMLYECDSTDCASISDAAVTVTELANSRDYLFAGLPDAEAGSGLWYELTWEASGAPGRYAWPLQTRTPQSTSAVVSYRVPATLTIAAGDTLPTADVTVSGLAADPSGSTVTFNLWTDSGTQALDDVPAALVDSDAQSNGTWTATFRHEWTAAETDDLSGSYYGRFTVAFSGGGVMTVPPAPGSLRVTVYP